MAVLPPLITEEGLVLNNMMPDQGALGGYTPLGTASSEGISLMIRGIARAALVTGNEDMKEFANFLFDAACTHFFGSRPSAEAQNDNMWHHSWICNGGAAFNVRGPLQGNGDLALSGYIYGRDTEASVVFTNGIGQLTPPPDIVYQVVSENAAFLWQNVFSDLTSGQAYEVDFYIDKAGNKVFGTQKGGSFGQPIVPAGQHTDGQPGRIVLKDPISTVCGVNYCVTVPDVKVPYGVLYEALPMWRHLADNEVSTAGDAIHWFLDAFHVAKLMEPGNPEWGYAYDRMMEVWEMTCDQASNNTKIFQSGANGPYNNFPLTYAYAYGRENIDLPDTNWNATPPTTRFNVERAVDGYVTFTMQNETAEIGSGDPIRYGVAFENSPLYIDFTGNSSFSVDMRSSVQQTVSMSIRTEAGDEYESAILIGPTSGVQNIGLGQFFRFQQEAGDSEGVKSGDWVDGGGGELPEYPAVPFPGRRVALIGDSITNYNTAYVAPKNGMYENWGTGICGYYTHADHILDGRLALEPGITTDVQGQKHGLNFAIAGTQVRNWWKELDDPLNSGTFWQGPMYAALANINRFDVVVMLGGTNDLADNRPAAEVLQNIKIAATDMAKNGKWVFLLTIPPRSRDYLVGYSLAEMDVIRQRLIEVNDGLRAWVASGVYANIWLVDVYDDLLGPNGIDPFGTASNDTDPLGHFTLGNYHPNYGELVAMHDGLHPGPAGAYVMGKKLAQVMIAAGVPARPGRTQLGSLTLGGNLLGNPSMAVGSYKARATTPPSYNLSTIGWATGLGAAIVAGNGNHAGYPYGSLPDCWNFWKSTNQENQVMGIGMGGNYSNFNEYTLSDFVGQFPKVLEYMGDATFPPGAITVSVVTDEGTPAIKVDFNIPVTGNKNESFVLSADVPRDQHGPWDNWGWNSPDNGQPRTNNMYNAGDYLLPEADVKLVNLNGSMVCCILKLSHYANVPEVSYGSVRQTVANHSLFWPPSDFDLIRIPTENRTMHLRAPAIQIPPYQSGETIRRAHLRLQVSFDCSVRGVTGSLIFKNPSVRKVTAGAPM